MRPRTSNHRDEGPDPASCQHWWRLRYVTIALPGPYVCEVCGRCGAMRLDGPDTITGPPTPVADGAAIHLASAARRRPPAE
jgi:hypothetical protein